MGPLIIAFGHRARQGKNVAADAIVRYYNDLRNLQLAHTGKSKMPKVQTVSFATALKEYCRVEHGMKEKDPKLLQIVGHEKRQGDPEYWIRRAWAQFKPDSDIILITDVRYTNEAQLVESTGGSIVDVQRFKDGHRIVADDRPADFPSEVELDNYPSAFILSNTNGHEALFCEQAITLAEYLWGIHSGR